MNIKCPDCQSSQVNTVDETQLFQAHFGTVEEIQLRFHKCLGCGLDWRHADNDSEIKQAIQRSEMNSVGSLLHYLEHHGVSKPYLESVLGIPQRTFKRLQEGEYSATAVALLRVIRIFPWIPDVIDAARHKAGGDIMEEDQTSARRED